MDPVHEKDGKWFFWTETWGEEIGPYDTERQARDALEVYCRNFLG